MKIKALPYIIIINISKPPRTEFSANLHTNLSGFTNILPNKNIKHIDAAKTNILL